MAISDRCIYLEATVNDGGVHAHPTWWLSPDVDVIAPNVGKATPTVPNTVQVRVHRKANCTPAGETVLVDVYVGDPSLTMTPSSNTTKITNTAGRPTVTVDPALLTPAGFIKTFTWNLGGTPPEQPGHKCLIAQCYPDSDSPGPSFDLPAEQHVAQHNLCIIPCTGGGGGVPMRGRGKRGAAAAPKEDCTLPVLTTNLNTKASELVTVTLMVDLDPSRTVLETVLPLLRRVPGFKGLSKARPQKYLLKFPEFPNAEVIDKRKSNLKQPSYAVQIKMAPKQTTKFIFLPDETQVRKGLAHIYHMTHANARKKVLGGLTAVVVGV